MLKVTKLLLILFVLNVSITVYSETEISNECDDSENNEEAPIKARSVPEETSEKETADDKKVRKESAEVKKISDKSIPDDSDNTNSNEDELIISARGSPVVQSSPMMSAIYPPAVPMCNCLNPNLYNGQINGPPDMNYQGSIVSSIVPPSVPVPKINPVSSSQQVIIDTVPKLSDRKLRTSNKTTEFNNRNSFSSNPPSPYSQSFDNFILPLLNSPCSQNAAPAAPLGLSPLSSMMSPSSYYVPSIYSNFFPNNLRTSSYPSGSSYYPNYYGSYPATNINYGASNKNINPNSENVSSSGTNYVSSSNTDFYTNYQPQKMNYYNQRALYADPLRSTSNYYPGYTTYPGYTGFFSPIFNFFRKLFSKSRPSSYYASSSVYPVYSSQPSSQSYYSGSNYAPANYPNSMYMQPSYYNPGQNQISGQIYSSETPNKNQRTYSTVATPDASIQNEVNSPAYSYTASKSQNSIYGSPYPYSQLQSQMPVGYPNPYSSRQIGLPYRLRWPGLSPMSYTYGYPYSMGYKYPYTSGYPYPWMTSNINPYPMYGYNMYGSQLPQRPLVPGNMYNGFLPNMAAMGPVMPNYYSWPNPQFTQNMPCPFAKAPIFLDKNSPTLHSSGGYIKYYQ